jgi:hypothetical protein
MMKGNVWKVDESGGSRLSKAGCQYLLLGGRYWSANDACSPDSSGRGLTRRTCCDCHI